jgi:methionine-rich copper-binding protein CopC
VRRARPKILFFVLVSLLAAATLALLAIDQERTEPEDGATLSRPPQNLRIWFSEAPIPSESTVELIGPSGPKELQGLHTMGYNDLMVRIVGRVEDGEYTAKWTTPDADGRTKSGEWHFTVKRGG